jgi:putative flavoprotein involved in K+ transport
MTHVHTLIIGGGQAGLALSRCLADRDVPHVVLERGRVGERWRSERWDSLRLLTPRWQARLPGWSYDGPDPDGYMSRTEVVDYLERYADSFSAPVETGVTVTSVERHPDGGFRVETDVGSWSCENVVIATGDCDTPFVPEIAERLPADVQQVVPSEYKNPAQLADGGVLVVGAAATGIQLASEIHASGRPVTLSVSRHTRLPRTYRGRDILWWLERMGIFDERAEDVADLHASRTQPSLQLVGTPDRRTLDLGVIAEEGVRLAGRMAGVEGGTVRFADDLLESTVAADVKLARLRLRIDAYARETGLDAEVSPPEPFMRVDVSEGPASIDLRGEGIRTVLWATGFVRKYPWLQVPVLDPQGEIRHRGGITPVPGLYVLGLRFLRRRNSSFIDGQAKDAAEIADHIAALRPVAAGI